MRIAVFSANHRVSVQTWLLETLANFGLMKTDPRGGDGEKKQSSCEFGTVTDKSVLKCRMVRLCKAKSGSVPCSRGTPDRGNATTKLALQYAGKIEL